MSKNKSKHGERASWVSGWCVSGDGCKTISRDHPWMERVAAVGVAASPQFWSSMGRKGVLDFEKGPRISILWCS